MKTFVPMLAAGLLFAQTPPAFEVATVKPSAPLDGAMLTAGKAHVGTRIDASRVDIGTASLFRMICTAYRLKPYQVAGPEWLKTTAFDIQARIPAGASADQLPEMLQTLLVERFGLKVHRESREQPVYALVVAKGGPKLQESVPNPEPDAPLPPGAPKPQEIATPTLEGDMKLTRTADGLSIEMPGGEIAGKVRMSFGRGGGSAPPQIHLASSNTTMKTFAEMLSAGVDRPVVDLTGLTGSYEVALDISAMDAMTAARAAVTFLPNQSGNGGNGGDGGAALGSNLADPSGSTIFSAVEKLGLKLEPQKLPLEMLVVDRVEKSPTAN